MTLQELHDVTKQFTDFLREPVAIGFTDELKNECCAVNFFSKHKHKVWVIFVSQSLYEEYEKVIFANSRPRTHKQLAAQEGIINLIYNPVIISNHLNIS